MNPLILPGLGLVSVIVNAVMPLTLTGLGLNALEMVTLFGSMMAAIRP